MIWQLDVPVPYPALGIAMALTLGVAIWLIACPGTQDTSGAFDDSWTIRTPHRNLVAYFAFCATFVLGALWLILLSRSSGFTDTSAGRTFPTIALVLGIVGLTAFGGGGLFGIVLVVFARHHSILQLTIDDEQMTVRQGIRKPITVGWTEVTDIRQAGPHRPAVADGLIINYRLHGFRRRAAQVFLPEIATGVDAATLESIFDARWQPDTGRDDT